jgi:hypothetical protein
MSEAQVSDVMKKLVWFMIGLAILGIIIAFVLYFGTVLPAQQAAALNAPTNNYCGFPPLQFQC